MDHLRKRTEFLDEKAEAELKVNPVDYDQKNLLFLSQSCSAFFETADKCLLVTTFMASVGLEWTDFKEWFEIHYIGKKEGSN